MSVIVSHGTTWHRGALGAGNSGHDTILSLSSRTLVRYFHEMAKQRCEMSTMFISHAGQCCFRPIYNTAGQRIEKPNEHDQSYVRVGQWYSSMWRTVYYSAVKYMALVLQRTGGPFDLSC